MIPEEQIPMLLRIWPITILSSTQRMTARPDRLTTKL
jgi:hypothetical protein